MDFQTYTSLSLQQMAGECDPAELSAAAFAAVRERDPQIGAFLEVLDGREPGSGDDGDNKVSLRGVPIGFKDNMNLVGTHTTCASKMLEDYVSPYTATCVQRCLDAGATAVGKLNMDEFAFGSSTETSAFHPTKNPWNLDCVPGGSSGGSAAAVAAGMLPCALGSDTGGSIRQPAAFCGVVGLKPTYGVVSRYGVVAFGSSLDQVGPLARSVEDAACLLDAIAGRDPRDCTSQAVPQRFASYVGRGVAGLKVGVVPAYLEAQGLHPDIRAALADAVAQLEQLGAQIVEVDLPHARAALSAYYVIGPAEAFSNLSRFDSVRYGLSVDGARTLAEQTEQSRTQGFGEEVVRRIMLGSYLLSSGTYNDYYYPAQQIRTLITQDYLQAFQQCDALLTPTTPTPAFRFGEVQDPTQMYLNDIFTIPINIAGNGGLSLPVGLGASSGLPVAIQIIGPQFKDENIIQVAGALESVYQWHKVAPLNPAS